METENTRLAEWLHMMHCPMVLSPLDLQRLNTPNMRSVWRHLQRHVQPLHGVQTVRQNLLLSILHKQNILPGEFGNFRVQSIQEFSQLKNMSNIQEEINGLKHKVKSTDEDLQTASINLLKKVNEKELLKCELQEKEDKALLFNLYRSRIQKELVKVNLEIENTTTSMKVPQNPASSTDMKLESSMVVNYLKKCIMTTSGTINDDAINDVIFLTLEFPAKTIYEGIFQVSYDALKSLNNCRAKLYNSSKKDSTVSGMYPLSKHLNSLNGLVFQNELDITNCLDNIRKHTSKLEKKKLILKSVIEETCALDSVEDDDDYEDLSANKLVNSLVTNTIYRKELEQLNILNNELNLECPDYDDLKLLVKKLAEEQKILFDEFNQTVSEVNQNILLVIKNKLDTVKTAVLKTCSEQVSIFFQELKLQHEDSESLFLSYKNIIGKECELIQNEPLNAILRKWEEPCELLPNNLTQDISMNPHLLSVLLQSQPKDILKSVLEQICWSYTIDYW